MGKNMNERGKIELLTEGEITAGFVYHQDEARDGGEKNSAPGRGRGM